MSNKSNSTIATMGIDIGKNSFHVVEPQSARRDCAATEWSCGQIESRLANMPPSDRWRLVSVVKLTPPGECGVQELRSVPPDRCWKPRYLDNKIAISAQHARQEEGPPGPAALLAPAAVPHFAGDCWTSAPGAYLPAASSSGTTANRHVARAGLPNRRDG
jgi:hypothetical protein